MGQGRILIIEDNEEMAALGQLILEHEGYQVLTAYDGATGLEILGRDPVDLVLLGSMMDRAVEFHHMDAWDVLERIKASDQLAHIPVIMLAEQRYLEDSPDTGARTKEAVHHRGLASYVVTPFTLSDLLGKIRKALVDLR